LGLSIRRSCLISLFIVRRRIWSARTKKEYPENVRPP
jgi:hypothetical protein